MNFSEALRHVKVGKRIYREGWNGKHLFVEAQRPDENSKMGNPYLYLDSTEATGNSVRIPWVPSQGDLFAEDWNCLIEEAMTEG